MSDIVERLRSADVLIVKSATDLRSVVAEEAADEIEKLRAALRLAFDAVEYWASYASPYAQEKHDLARDVAAIIRALGEKE